MTVKIFVSNLCETVNEQHLLELFGRYGKVTSLKLMMSNNTGRSEKFAFIEMPGKQEAGKAITQLNNLNFMGSFLEISEVRPVRK